MQTLPLLQSNEADPQFQALQDLIKLVRQMASDLDHLSTLTESQLHDLGSQINQTKHQIHDLKTGLPDPPPIIEDWSDSPKPKADPKAQPVKELPPEVKDASQSDLPRQIAALIQEQQRLPARLERSLLSSLLSTLNFQKWIYFGLAAMAAHALLTTFLITLALHLLPPPLNARNEAQLHLIYQKVK